MERNLMMEQNLYIGIGKRKTSVAKIILTKGSGQTIINKKSLRDYFSGMEDETVYLKKAFLLVDLKEQYDVIINVKGGGISSQLDAIKLGIAKAVSSIDEKYRQILTKNQMLRRDARIKERRKYGLKKARKASQYSKR
jgi:small subunit ribosomal protein S9